MLVLHIGPHKTATTYIQHNLFLARELLAEDGWVYPAVGMQELRAHHDLAHNPKQYMAPGGQYYEELARLPDLVEEEGKGIVFSAEGFCRWKPDQFTRLGEIVKDDDMHLVYVIRDPLSVFYSYWTEEVKQGYSTSLPVRFSEIFNNPFRSRLLNSSVDLAPLMQAKNIKVHVIMYERIHQLELDIFEILLSSVMGVVNIDAKELARANESYPIELTEFLRLLTLRKANGQRHIGSSLRHAFIKCSTAKERDEIVEAINTFSSTAKRAIKIPRDTGIMRMLERRVRDQLPRDVTPILDEQSIFLKEPAVWDYYDEFALHNQPIVAAMLDHYTSKIEAEERS